MSIKSRVNKLEDRRGDTRIVLPQTSDCEETRTIRWLIGGKEHTRDIERRYDEDKRAFDDRVSIETVAAIQASRAGRTIVLDPAYNGV